MRSLTLGLALLFVPVTLSGQNVSDCDGAGSLAALYSVRDAMVLAGSSSSAVTLKIDEQLHLLRDPLSDGSYRWVRLVRPAGEPPVVRREKVVHAIRGNDERDTFEARGTTPFAVGIVVPRKRSLLRGNNPVWIGDVRIHVEADGERESIVHPVNEWLRPDTSRSFDLGIIADSATVEVEAATNADASGAALIEVHFSQAVSQDDPLNPEAAGVLALQRIGSDPDPDVVDYEIAAMEREVLGLVRSVPYATLLARVVEAEALMRSEKEEDRVRGTEMLAGVVKDLKP